MVEAHEMGTSMLFFVSWFTAPSNIVLEYFRWIGLVETNHLPFTFFVFGQVVPLMLKVRKNGQFGHSLHAHLQSTIKHNCVIIIYIQGTLFFFFSSDYIYM